MKSTTFLSPSFLFICCLLFGCQSTENKQADELFTQWNSDHTPGVAFAVVQNGAIIHQQGFGQANLEYGVPITPTTVFHIASISKQFTVFAIMLLEKEGKLSLDDDIRKYVPEVPDFGKTITLRHLASHTSGLRDQWELLVMAGWRMDDVITTKNILKLISRQQQLNFDPGEQFMYCNTGFTLLAEVVARVSGQRFAEFTVQYIFQPLDMQNTLFYDDHEKVVKNRAYSYYQDSTGYKKSVLNYANVGATSLFTTVEDLSRWTTNFYTGQVGDTSIFRTMNTPIVLNNGESMGGALGQFVGEYKGLREIQHGGADAGYRTHLSRFPDQQFAVIVFSNDASMNAGGLAHQLADIYLADSLEVEPEPEEKAEKEIELDITIEKEALNSYSGDYELQPGFIINITNDQSKLYAKVPNEPQRSLNPISNNEFSIDGWDGTVTFPMDSAGEISVLKLSAGGQKMEAARVKPLDLSPQDLTEYTGRYYSEELVTTYTLAVVDTGLVAKHIRLSNISLAPRKKDIFSGDTWAFGEVSFVRNANDAITGFQVSSGRVKNILFTKVKKTTNE
ncbi:serine hydrolase domain-containing protein [Tunicatimonas pelagia]|uniref:serine hydrolase domain-containing protein n=1 Tax=Tunicatimonas pelagia TaxID=931531 RepID=UPI0026668119|nr:serine hydrolase domain-containing protein [Tunicatimonas pelagia]WKN42921.1 serine hydrolase [Tunicatimonas pelagia]